MKKISLTISIPAFNEEQNIVSLLNAILKQKLSTVVLKEIAVFSDASTDKTHDLVSSLQKKYKLIKLVKGATRKGKYFRMNEMFEKCKTDALLIIDADIAMVNDIFIETLVGSLSTDPHALMVSARNIFVQPKGFTARVLHAYFTMWDNILLSLPEFESSGQFSGTATLFRGSYARTLRIPSHVTNPHLFLYLASKSRHGFRFCTQALILQYVPSTINEVKTMLVRAIFKPDKALDKLFGKEFIRAHQQVPVKLKLLVMVKSFFQNPFYTPLAIIMTVYIGRLGRKLQTSKSQLWEINLSTKKTIVYAK